MRITIDTREDSYEDALGVLRRAYGRHRLARKAEESPAVPEAVDLSSGERSGGGIGRPVCFRRRPGGRGVEEAFG